MIKNSFLLWFIRQWKNSWWIVFSDWTKPFWKNSCCWRGIQRGVQRCKKLPLESTFRGSLRLFIITLRTNSPMYELVAQRIYKQLRCPSSISLLAHFIRFLLWPCWYYLALLCRRSSTKFFEMYHLLKKSQCKLYYKSSVTSLYCSNIWSVLKCSDYLFSNHVFIYKIFFSQYKFGKRVFCPLDAMKGSSR